MSEPTPFDNTQAEKEGWAIFDCAGTSENGRWQLQRDDESEVFTDDAEAWRFVNHMAETGSQYHQEALEWLAMWNQQEFEAIQRAVRK
jgi:hypothetical protein